MKQERKNNSARLLRNSRLTRSLLTSGIARISGILLQAVSLPLAAAALGAQEFSLYAMVSAVLAWLTLSNMGLSQAVTLEISSSINANDSREGERYLARALVVSIAISIVVCAIIATTMTTSILDIVFYRTVGDERFPINEIIFVLIVFFVIQILTVFEGYQLAQQKQYELNLHMALGTLFSAVAVWIVSTHEPTVLSILMAVHIPVILARILNTVKVSRYVTLRISDFYITSWYDLAPVLRSGLRFVSGTSISNFFCHPFTILVVGATTPIAESASYAAVINAILLAASLLGYVMSPVRGAVPEAYSRGEFLWIRRAYKATFFSMLLYVAGPSFLLIFFGSELFDFWYQGIVNPASSLLIGAGVYLIFYCIETVNYNFLVSVGFLQKASRVVFSKGIFVAVLSIPVSIYIGSNYVIWIIVVSIAVFSCVPLLVYARESILK